ncbi:hypothetical protein GCM10009604_05620 [Corynebacterium aurimucosum]
MTKNWQSQTCLHSRSAEARQAVKDKRGHPKTVSSVTAWTQSHTLENGYPSARVIMGEVL